MSDVKDEVKADGDQSIEQQQASPKVVDTDIPKTFVETDHNSLDHCKKNEDNEAKEGDPPKQDEIINTVRLVGEPLATHGPYTFYSALAYRKRNDVTKKKRRRWKKPITGVDDESDNAAESYDSSSSCCCANNDTGKDLCFYDNCSSSSRSSSSSHSEWPVVHMNHFYPVRPWYSKKNSSISDGQQQGRHRENSPKLTKTTTVAAERRQHHYQQSVCIGELELLWRDDSVVTSSTAPLSSSQLKKRNSNKIVPSALLTVESNGGDDGTDPITSSSNIHGEAVASSDEDDGVSGGFDDDSSSLLPRRRTLPRRTRQPSAKKLEAAESYAAVAAAAASDNHHSSQSPYNRSRLSTAAPSDPTSVSVPLLSPDAQYSHGNVLCSVRLYVMPDQTATGRLGGVHGEDEVLEINTWSASGGAERWPSNIFINGNSSVGSIYNGSGSVDDYGYGSGSHSSGTLPSGCSGLVLRAEDFVEWVRGGLMNDDDENEDTESDDESLESDCDDNSSNDRKCNRIETSKPKDEQLSSLVKDTMADVKQFKEEIFNTWDDDKNSKVKLEPTLIKDEVITENLLSVNPVKVKMEQEELTVNVDFGVVDGKTIKQKHDNTDINYYSKYVVDEAVEAENVPLAAARIHKKQCEHVTERHRRCRRQRHRLNQRSLVNGNSTSTVAKKNDRRHYNVSAVTNKGTTLITPNFILFLLFLLLFFCS